jgi:hypothetical protein
MLRSAPVFLALGLAMLWLIGLAEDATVWLTWVVGTLALPLVATTGLVPEREGSGWAALSLWLVAFALGAAWAVGWRTEAAPWLTWWTLVFAALTLLTGTAVAMQDRIDALRTPPVI